MPLQKRDYNDQMSFLYPDLGMTKSVTFQVTDACNMRCKYCYEVNKGNHKMPLDVAKRFIDGLFNDAAYDKYLELQNTSSIILDFIGGEPFLEVELIDRIIDYYVESSFKRSHFHWAQRFMVSITTNGYNYFDEAVQRFIQKHRGHLSLNITIDGNQELHDACRLTTDGKPTYAAVEKAVLHYMKLNSGTQTKVTLAPQNIGFLNDAIQNLIRLGFTGINANCVFEDVWALEDAKIFYDQLKRLADDLLDSNQEDTLYCSLFDERYFIPESPSCNENWCGGTGKMLAVDWKGDLFPCVRYTESSLVKGCAPMIIGNVVDGLAHNAAACGCIAELKSITRRSQSNDRCFHCPIGKGCAWCSAQNYQMFGTANKRSTAICLMHQARALANVYFWNKYYRKHGIPRRFPCMCPEDWALNIIDGDELALLKKLEKEETL